MTIGSGLTIVLSVFGGAVAGAVVATWSGISNDVSLPRASVPNEPKTRPHGVTTRIIERHIIDRSASTDSSNSEQSIPESMASGTVPHEPHVEAPPRSAEERRLEFERKLDAVRVEGRDPDWAATTERSLARSLAQLEEQLSLQLVSVNCHTTRCEAAVEWDSFDEALTQQAALLAQPMNANCGVQFDYSSGFGQGRELPFRTSLIFECEDWRSNGSIGLLD